MATYPVNKIIMIPLKKFVPAIGWFFLVLYLICLPGNQFPKTDDWLKVIYFDKWVHFGLFGILTFLWIKPFAISNIVYTQKLQACIKITMSIIVWGLTTEYIQKYFIPFRAFDLWDWAADSIGAALAFAVCYKMYLAQKKE